MTQNPITTKELAREIANALHFLGDCIGHAQNSETPTDCKPALTSLMYARTSIEVVRNYNTLGGNANLKLFQCVHHIDNAYIAIKEVVSEREIANGCSIDWSRSALECVNLAIKEVIRIKAQLVEQAAYERLQTKRGGKNV